MSNEIKESLEEILNLVKNLDKRVAQIEGSGSVGKEIKSQSGDSNKKMSLKEFLISRSANNDLEKTLSIGYFLETYEKMTSFNRADLVGGFRLAKEPLPANINDKVNMCIGNGHMMEEGKKDNTKAWVLTRSGEQEVEKGFLSEKPVKKSVKKTANKSESSPKPHHNSKTKESYKVVGTLNLIPTGKESFRAFVDQKKPQSNMEINTIAVYYLEKVLNVEKISPEYVYSCYKNIERKVPEALIQSLRDTASTKGWINSTEITNIKMNVAGENFVEHDLPRKTDK